MTRMLSHQPESTIDAVLVFKYVVEDVSADEYTTCKTG
jgi:hypothetical protein